MTVKNPLPAVADENSRILILGSMPSERSREEGFYYSHPGNRFWKVLAAAYQAKEPKSIAEKREFILSRGLSLWDVIDECEIERSSDTSIVLKKPNDIAALLKGFPIKKVFANGRKAYELYKRHITSDIEADYLPSTSAANASFSLERLVSEWKRIVE